MSHSCSRRLFLVGTATTFAGILLSACGKSAEEVPAADVPVGSAIIVGRYIIAQPTAGEYKAYSTQCPHANQQIDQVLGDKVKCPGHGSEFRLSDGAVLNGPARDPLREADVTPSGDTLVVS
ncbi:iron-sulfur protein [Corynebacterium atypicum]|uniref:Iron-sulfur protein n=1 Tax=Corynebacterium atypicum TaxID=191610 RepID=A0ABM5QQ85_9CORY|nr:Rieske 2Fe-2S domain-containing protein [Corynebacterium atypicum]AIG64879.1 iron-sulfur protein [Corynebacterium atypicum]